jgi:hypothetical protein
MIEPKPKHERDLTYYLFERAPGLVFFIILIFLFAGGLFAPTLTAYFILVLNVYFLYKSAMLTVTYIIAIMRINQGESLDWKQKLDDLEDIPAAIAKRKAEIEVLKSKELEVGFYSQQASTDKTAKRVRRLPKFMKEIMFAREKAKSINFLKKEIQKLEKVQVKMNWREIQQIIIIPHVKEPEHILRETLEGLKKQSFPHEQINIVLAAEARDPNGLPLSEKLAEEYKGMFNNIWVSNHVLKDIEIVGKSSNMKAGGEVAYANVEKLGWDLKKTIITSCDADSKLPVHYFSYVTHEYVTINDPEYKYFNAAVVFYNNIWRLPFYARVKNSMSSLFNIARLVRVDKLIPFSTYSVSFWMVKEIGFWTPWVTPEDFHLFLKGHFKFGSQVSVVPVYLQILSDAAEGLTHKDTVLNNYMQERRWQWGISDDGWVLQNIFYRFTKHDPITIYRGLHSVFDHIMTPILGIVLIVGGNIPPFINPAFHDTVLGARLPQVSSTIITIASVFAIILILLDLRYKPKKDKGWWLSNSIISLAEWFILPVASFFMAVLPGVEANTRLLFGQYLEYYVTKKH